MCVAEQTVSVIGDWGARLVSVELNNGACGRPNLLEGTKEYNENKKHNKIQKYNTVIFERWFSLENKIGTDLKRRFQTVNQCFMQDIILDLFDDRVSDIIANVFTRMIIWWQGPRHQL